VIEGRITPRAMTMKYVKRKKGVIYMVFNTGAALLDAIVLAVVSHETEGTYGYKITQEVRLVIEISESTLYPVLRRLQKDECLQIYDMECAGRNRRYYRITEKGRAQLNLYISEWYRYSAKLNSIFEGGLKNE
jgi:PadR family transcriptional regulator PadR